MKQGHPNKTIESTVNTTRFPFLLNFEFQSFKMQNPNSFPTIRTFQGSNKSYVMGRIVTQAKAGEDRLLGTHLLPQSIS